MNFSSRTFCPLLASAQRVCVSAPFCLGVSVSIRALTLSFRPLRHCVQASMRFDSILISRLVWSASLWMSALVRSANVLTISFYHPTSIIFPAAFNSVQQVLSAQLKAANAYTHGADQQWPCEALYERIHDAIAVVHITTALVLRWGRQHQGSAARLGWGRLGAQGLALG